jgi:hypothetical protein
MYFQSDSRVKEVAEKSETSGQIPIILFTKAL